MKLKPHQIGILIALALAALLSVVWINGGQAGLARNGQLPDSEPIAK